MVSAIVSVYNGKLFIENCINDLINQTLYKKNILEIIIVVSASIDNAENIILNFQKKYKNIHYIRTAERESLYKAWNRGIKYSSGNYITNANIDDIHRFDALEIMFDELENNSEIDLVYHYHYLSKIINQPYEKHINEKKIYYPEFDNRTIYQFYPFCHQNMWRKSIHEKIGFFDESYLVAGDLDFAFRFCINGHKAKLIKDFLGVQISRDDQLCVNEKSQDEINTIIAKYFNSENIFKLYKAIGFSVETDQDKFLIIRDLFYKLLKYKFPGNENYICNSYLSAHLLVSLLQYNFDENLINDYVNYSLNFEVVKDFYNFNETLKKIFPEQLYNLIISKFLSNIQ